MQNVRISKISNSRVFTVIWALAEREHQVLQHAETGLFLHSETDGHAFYTRGEPWETCGARLSVAPRDGSGAQRWTRDGTMLRSVQGGRALDVNFGTLRSGVGVNVNIPSGATVGSSWLFEGGWRAPESMLAEPPTATPITHGGRRDASFSIRPGIARDFALSVRDRGGEHEVYLAAKDDSCIKQRWRVVDGERFRAILPTSYLRSLRSTFGLGSHR